MNGGFIMKKALFCIFIVFSAAGAFAQQPVVAVAPFDVISNAVSAEQAGMINDVFFVRLGNTRAVNLVNRNIVERVLREHSFQADDWSNGNKTAELARALNANWMVQGNIRKSGNFLLIIVQFYDIRTFEFKGGTDLRLANADEAYDKIDPLVSNLIETISGSGGRTAVTPPAAATSGTYNVGDTGPAGGIIFYDRGFVADGWQYLEAAPANTDFRAEWGAYTGNSGNNYSGRDVPGTGTAVGSGKRNTQIIVDRLRGWGENERAAQICAGMNINGFNDWFLPSKDELDLMYKNLKQKNLGSFSNDFYWSSSQDGNHTAWCQRFSSGFQFNTGKDSAITVRAVRAF
jgi:TolB-like protein